MMFGDEPTVVQEASPSEESISTRTVAAVPEPSSITRTL